MKRMLCMMLVLISLFGYSVAEEENQSLAYVTVKLLNGRARPNKKGFVEARFDYKDSLVETGEWSEDHNWIEVLGGETGTVWVHIKYVTEREAVFYVENVEYREVKIRKHPIDGKVSGRLKKGQQIMIDQVVLGWGHCSKGWIDLYYVDEVADE